MSKGFVGPMAMGLVAGAALGMAAIGMTTGRERRRLRQQAEKTVKDILGQAKG